MSDSILLHCKECNQDKPEKEFSRTRGATRQPFCKACLSQRQKNGYVSIHPPTTPEGHKQCPRCKQILLATSEFFYSNKSKFDGLSVLCKACHRGYEQTRIQQISKTPLPETFVCTKCNEEKPATPAFSPVYRHIKSGLGSMCRVCCNALKRAYYHTHPEYREYYAVYEKNISPEKREHKKAYVREWYHANRHRQSEYKRIHRQLPHVRIYKRVANHRRRALQMQAPGSHVYQDIQQQYDRQKGRCYWCDLKLSDGRQAYHVDHVIPLSRGGSNGPENIVITCPHCNESKKDRLPHEWSGNNGKLW